MNELDLFGAQHNCRASRSLIIACEQMALAESSLTQNERKVGAVLVRRLHRSPAKCTHYKWMEATRT